MKLLGSPLGLLGCHINQCFTSSLYLREPGDYWSFYMCPQEGPSVAIALQASSAVCASDLCAHLFPMIPTGPQGGAV